MTYNFEVQANGGISLKVNDVYKKTLFKASVLEVIDEDTFDIIDSTGGRHRYEMTLKSLNSNGSISTAPNVFKIEGVTINGTVEDVCYELSTVFPNATVTGGVDGSSITSLDQVPQGTASKKLTATEYQFLKDLIASTST